MKPPAGVPAVTDDDDNRMAHEIARQELAPQHVWTPSADKMNPHPALFLAAEPFYALPNILSASLRQYPLRTDDLAHQMEVFRLWHDLTVAANMTTELEFQQRQKDIVTRLMMRQQPDGSFAALPDDKGDVDATVAAVIALANSDAVSGKAALAQAVAWLKHQLDTSWFDEKERPFRAAAYAALAAAGQLDVAALRYFADANADKPLPPMAALQLSYAFSKANDKDKASQWLAAAHVLLTSPDLPLEFLPWLAPNNFVDPHDLLPALMKLSDSLTAEKSGVLSRMIFLRAIWDVHNRGGDWRASIGGVEKLSRGIMATGAAPPVKNLSARSLYLSTIEFGKNLPVQTPITRHIYRPDGGEAVGSLTPGAPYVVVLEGPWNTNDVAVVHDDVGPVLQPITCALENAGSSGLLVWLASFTKLRSCEKVGQGMDVVVGRDGDTAPNWRIVYLARAESVGAFNLAAPVATSLSGDHPIMGRRQRVRVK